MQLLEAALRSIRTRGVVSWSRFIRSAWRSSSISLKLPAVPQPQLALSYRGRTLQQKYRPDFICYGKIVLEIKAVSALVDEHRAQVLNYLNATGFELGLLVNFGHYPGLEYERIVNTAKLSRGPGEVLV